MEYKILHELQEKLLKALSEAVGDKENVDFVDALLSQYERVVDIERVKRKFDTRYC